MIMNAAIGRIVTLACALSALPAAAMAQAPTMYSGVWVVEASDTDARDVYGEVRVVRHVDNELRLSMIDYGTAWIGGAFRGVVRIMPWTFRFDDWGPRRGLPGSSQPRTRARLSGGRLVLAKVTERGNGDFVWVWDLSENQTRLAQWESPRSWGQELGDGPVREGAVLFTRTSPPENSTGIVVRLDIEGAGLLAHCPTSDCRIVQFQSGRQIGVSALPKGQPLAIPLDAEVRIEPVP